MKTDGSGVVGGRVEPLLFLGHHHEGEFSAEALRFKFFSSVTALSAAIRVSQCSCFLFLFPARILSLSLYKSSHQEKGEAASPRESNVCVYVRACVQQCCLLAAGAAAAAAAAAATSSAALPAQSLSPKIAGHYLKMVMIPDWAGILPTRGLGSFNFSFSHSFNVLLTLSFVVLALFP